MPELPSGTVTFLFTDLEGSTRLWEQVPEPMRKALARHDAILEESIAGHGGVVFSRMGDGMAAAFPSAPDAVGAALDAQLALAAESWPETGPLRARMGLHTGLGVLVGGDQYANQPLNRCARLMAAAHGGQVLMSGTTEALVEEALPPGTHLLDLGDHRLRDLARPLRVFQLVHAALRTDFPPLRSLDTFPTNLPVQATSFIGRDHELTSVPLLLDQHRIVTLTGVGGVGKTRLALQVAAEVLPTLRDGAFLVELGAVVDADVVADVVAGTIGVPIGQGESATAAVLAHLANRQLLLILDNCEHLLATAAAFTDSVMRHCRDVRLLATSREPLGVAGEQVVLVPSLGLPSSGDPPKVQAASDSVLLLADRASMVRADFSPSEQNTESLAQICRRLDGIPLALELAAARLRSMTPAEIASRLDQRFRLLTGGGRSVANRHQTLRRTIDWSYELLDEEERRVLQRVAVCTAGFDLRAAERICSGGGVDALDVVDALARLTDKSLVGAEDIGESTRYRMLETIRDYALERLEQDQDVAEVRTAHAAHYAEVASAMGLGLRGKDERAWIDELRRDLENLRVAVLWSLENGQVDVALEAVASLAIPMLPTDHAVGGWAESAVEVEGAAAHPRFAEVAGFASFSAMRRGDLDRASALRAKALDAMPHGPEAAGTRARVLDAVWIVSMVVDGADAWIAMGEARVDEARAAADEYELARALAALAVARASQGIDVRELAREALSVARRVGNPTARASASMALGQALAPFDGVAALEALSEAEEFARQAGNDAIAAVINGIRGFIVYSGGETRGAATVLHSLEVQVDQGYATYVQGYVRLLAGALAAARADEPAAVLLGYWTLHHPAFSSVLGANDQDAAAVAGLPERLGASRYEELMAEGAAITDVTVLLSYARAAISELS